jgi:ABC-type polar amino acid transport system ATPase subunit
MTVLAVEGVELRREGRCLVSGLSFSMQRGERVALMGPSGAGKTTILRVIAGLEEFADGAITVEGATVSARSAAAARAQALQRRVGLVFQFHHLFAHMSALQNVWLAPVHVLKRRREDAERDARVLLERLGVAHRADALPEALSGGEAQRVAIARALAVNPPLLLMDEPTASLDPARRTELVETLRGLSADGTTVLVSTHDEEFARRFAQRVLVLDGGAGRWLDTV